LAKKIASRFTNAYHGTATWRMNVFAANFVHLVAKNVSHFGVQTLIVLPPGE